MQPPKRTAIARTLRKRETWAEELLWRCLRDRRFSDYKFRRQHAFGPHVLDFFCVEAFLDIELDGFQHGHPASRIQDAKRDEWLEARGVKVLRVWNSQLRGEKEMVMTKIWQTLQERVAHPL